MMTSEENTAQTEPVETSNAFSRFVDSQPILNMLDLMHKTGRSHFTEDGAWEVCLCALILKLEPGCKIQRILESLPYHTNLMDETDVLNTMSHMGYSCRPAEADLYDIDERLLPGLFIPNGGSPKIPCLVLGRNENNELLFYDPISRLVSAVPPGFDKNGKVWFFQKYDEHAQPISHFMRQGSGHTWFRALMGRFKGTFAQVMTAGLILNIIALVTPLFIMLVYDRVIAAGAPDTLPMLAVGAFIAIAFEWRLRAIRSRGLSWLSGRLDNIVGNRIFSHLIGLSPDMIERASVAAQIARIKTFESVRDFFSGSVFLSLLEAPFVIISLAAIAFIAGPLVFVPVVMGFAYLALFWFIRGKVKVAIRLAAKTSSARQQFTIETFEKLEGVVGQGLQQKWQEKFRHLSGREMMSHFYLGWLGTISETLAHTLTIISAVAVIGFGAHLIWAGMLTTGALVATMILVWRVLTPLYSLCTMVPRLEQLRNSIDQVNNLMDIETEAEEARSFSRLPRIKGEVSFHHVDFRYDEDQDYIFTDLSFKAEAGDVVILTGANGSGKTDVLKLIKSLQHASQGTVRIDGFDIRQLDAPDLRRQIAYIPKSAHFYYGSVLENMRMANPLATMEDIEQALKLANAYDDIRTLPQQMDTIIGSYGEEKLTSSLASRLSIARAYLHPGNILLIDELPNSLLSGVAGKNLKNYIASVKGKRTVIMCTYRTDFMKLSDTIVWLRGLSAPIVGNQDIMLAQVTIKGAVA